MIQVDDNSDGVRFAIRVRAGAKKNKIAGEHDGALRVDVTPAPERGKANEAVIVLVAKELGVLRSAIEIVKGATSRHKVIRLAGMSKEQLKSRLDQLLAEHH